MSSDNAAKRKALGRRIETERNKRGLTFGQLANKAGCNEKTIRKMVHGQPIRGKILYEVCAALSLNAEESFDRISDEDHGGYTSSNFADYVGQYFAYRRGLTFPKNILQTVFVVNWSVHANCLRFKEYHRYDSPETKSTIDHSQSGEIFISNEIGLLHFVTKYKGAIRLITVSKFRLNDSTDFTLQGIVLTQAKRHFHYQPSAVAIILRKTAALPTNDIEKNVMVITPTDPQYPELDNSLKDVECQVVNFALAPSPIDPIGIKKVT